MVFRPLAAKSSHKLIASQGGGSDCQFRMGRGQIKAKGVTIEGLAHHIAQQVRAK